jgi:hypothetical protein
VFCHHDAFLPPFMNGMNVDAAAEAVRTRTPGTEPVTMSHGVLVEIFAEADRGVWPPSYVLVLAG